MHSFQIPQNYVNIGTYEYTTTYQSIHVSVTTCYPTVIPTLPPGHHLWVAPDQPDTSCAWSPLLPDQFKIDRTSGSVSDKARDSWLQVVPSGQYSN